MAVSIPAEVKVQWCLVTISLQFLDRTEVNFAVPPHCDLYCESKYSKKTMKIMKMPVTGCQTLHSAGGQLERALVKVWLMEGGQWQHSWDWMHNVLEDLDAEANGCMTMLIKFGRGQWKNRAQYPALLQSFFLSNTGKMFSDCWDSPGNSIEIASWKLLLWSMWMSCQIKSTHICNYVSLYVHYVYVVVMCTYIEELLAKFIKKEI